MNLEIFCRNIIMTENFQRYSLFPIKYPNLFRYYEDQRDNFWVPKEIDLETDVTEWRDVLTDNDRHFLTHTLAFFAQADGIVLHNLDNHFSLDIDIPEANIFYGIQAGIEAIHWETYAILIDTLVTNPVERDKANQAIENYPCIKKKAAWICKWMTNSQPFMERLVAFACTEGIFFSSAFASIFYYKKRGLMPGLSLSNKFIARDEGLHRDFGCELFKTLLKEHPEKYQIDPARVLEIIRDAVTIEEEFVDNSLNVELIGINKNLMKSYVRFVTDHLLVTLGFEKYYQDANPFDWMDLISLTSKQNFFEGRVSEYKKNRSDTTFEIVEDF
jgi:ribonucleotide reductase beta subunit family protein with ferritin-like domain